MLKYQTNNEKFSFNFSDVSTIFGKLQKSYRSDVESLCRYIYVHSLEATWTFCSQLVRMCACSSVHVTLSCAPCGLGSWKFANSLLVRKSTRRLGRSDGMPYAQRGMVVGESVHIQLLYKCNLTRSNIFLRAPATGN